VCFLLEVRLSSDVALSFPSVVKYFHGEPLPPPPSSRDDAFVDFTPLPVTVRRRDVARLTVPRTSPFLVGKSGVALRERLLEKRLARNPWICLFDPIFSCFPT